MTPPFSEAQKVVTPPLFPPPLPPANFWQVPKLVYYMYMFTNVENRFMTSQFTNTQPAEFTQYIKFQHFTRCVHQKFCCAFTSILAVKQGKIDWIDHETFPIRYYLIKRYRLLYFGITMKLTSIDQPWP